MTGEKIYEYDLDITGVTDFAALRGFLLGLGEVRVFRGLEGFGSREK